MIARRLLALLIAVCALCPALAAARQPNVILILADDLGYQDLGCYGHPSIRTPVLDRLAGEGIRLTDFHSGASVCTPSRMALLTGAYPTRVGWTHGVCGYLMGDHDGMNPEALTIAEIFKSEGYVTGISGKWHVGDQPDTRPNAQGFDSTYYLSHSNNQTKKVWRANEVVENPFDNRKLTEQFTTESIRFIREYKDKPFFLYLPYTAPHFPVQPHPDWKGRSKFGDYGDVVEEMDARIGELLATLKELAIDKDTIVIFTSDNGPNPKEPSSPLPFRGEKWSALEGGTRVPCIVAWPGVIPVGQVNDSLISAMDLLPSLCRASGIDWKSKTHGKPKIDGIDVWDTLLGKTNKNRRNELLYWHGRSPEPHAFRSGESKLFFDRSHAFQGSGTERATTEQSSKIAPIRAKLTSGANPPILFNLRDDPGETTDQSEAFPDKLKALRVRAETLIAELKADPILPLSTPPNVLFLFSDDQRHDTIHALGNESIRTPHIDRLVGSGVAFRNAYIMGASSPAVCSPSRACLMSGRTLWNIECQGEFGFEISAKYKTLPQVFRENGYVTFGTGKNEPGRTGAFGRSFSTGDKILFRGMTKNQYKLPLCAFSPDGKYPDGAEVMHEGKHSAEVYADACVRFLEGQGANSQPFFAYVAFQTPHDPRQCPPEFREMYQDDKMKIPASFVPRHPFDNGMLDIRDEKLAPFPRTEQVVRKHLADYYSVITHTDVQIGRILDALEKSGKRDNTIIVFSSDNGLAMGSHGLMGKQNVYDPSVHVPLIIAGPGIPKGETRDALCYIYDLYPTLCERAGLNTPGTVQFQSLNKVIDQSSAESRGHLYYAFMSWQRAVRDKQYKLIEYCVGKDRHTQLFDLTKDPQETQNLADNAAHADTLARLRKLLQEDRVRLNDGNTPFPFSNQMGKDFWSAYDVNGR